MPGFVKIVSDDINRIQYMMDNYFRNVTGRSDVDGIKFIIESPREGDIPLYVDYDD